MSAADIDRLEMVLSRELRLERSVVEGGVPMLVLSGERAALLAVLKAIRAPDTESVRLGAEAIGGQSYDNRLDAEQAFTAMIDKLLED